MALTSLQQASRLFKKSFGAGESLVAKEFFSEPRLGRDNLFLSQIWAQSDLIPTTAPILTDEQTIGVVKYKEKLTLSVVAGSTNLSYYHAELVDAIPFNFGDGTYNYTLYKNDGTTTIAFGAPGGDWLVDTSAGLLTWYGGLPSGVSDVLPPKISFYKYVGTKGFTDLSTSLSTEASLRISSDLSLSTSISSGVAGGISTEISQRISSDNSLSTLISSENSQRISSDSLLQPKIGLGLQTIESTIVDAINEVNLIAKGAQKGRAMHDYSQLVYVVSNYLFDEPIVGQSIYIMQTDVPDLWVSGISDPEFAIQYTYTSDQDFINAINAGGGQIQIEYIRFSLLETQKVDLTDYVTTSTVSTETSLRISTDISLSTSLSTEVSERVSSDTSLSTSLSTEVSERVSSDTSLSTSLSTEVSQRSSADTSLSTSLSIEVSERISSDTSISTSLSTETSSRLNMAGNGLGYDVDSKLEVLVDEYTIKIINDELRTPETWMEFDSTTTILTGVGATNIVLDYDPVGYVSAYINGIEYLVSPSTTAISGCPFYFTVLPVKDSVLYFSTTEAGFSLVSGVDLISVKYHYISSVV